MLVAAADGKCFLFYGNVWHGQQAAMRQHQNTVDFTEGWETPWGDLPPAPAIRSIWLSASIQQTTGSVH